MEFPEKLIDYEGTLTPEEVFKMGEKNALTTNPNVDLDQFFEGHIQACLENPPDSFSYMYSRGWLSGYGKYHTINWRGDKR